MQKDSRDKYVPLDLFMIRTPLLPVDHIKAYFNSEQDLAQNLEEILNCPEILEAIAIASPSLYKSLLKPDKNDRQQQQMIGSLFKYMNRMSTRATPFGLFSGVDIGVFGSENAIQVGTVEQHVKRARPDMQWLLRIIKNIEEDHNIVKELDVRFNQIAYKIGDRIKIPFITSYGDYTDSNKDFTYASVNWNEIVDLVSKQAYEPINMTELNQIIHSRYNQVDRQTVENFTFGLFKNEFLLSTLRPPLTDANAFDYLIEKIRPIKELHFLYEKLLVIRHSIHTYNQQKIGEGLSIYESTVTLMNQLAEVKTPLQIDLKSSLNHNMLNESIKGELSQAADILLKLSPQTSWYKHLSKYHEEFIEAYGVAREVPLCELLDEDIGLGAPPTYENPKSDYVLHNNYEEDIVYSRKLMNYAQEAILKREELQLTDAIVDDLKVSYEDDFLSPPDSMELYFSIISPEQDASDYELIMGPNPGSAGAGKSFGRFLDMVDPAVTDQLKKNAKEHPNKIFAEVVYLPRHSKAINVVMTRNLTKHQIVIGTSSNNQFEEITLDDLVVGSYGYRFYLKSRKLNKEIVPVTNHMLNFTSGTPNLYRFLCELGISQYKNWRGFYWGMLSRQPYLPRVRYGKIVFSPATWNVDHKIIAFSSNHTEQDKVTLLRQWREQYQVPQFIYLTEADNRIMYDLSSEFHLKQLVGELSKLPEDGYLVLTEIESQFSNFITKSEDKRPYYMEAVFPLSRKIHINAQDKYIQNEKEALEAYSTVTDTIRVYPPGSEWMYFKIYGMKSRADEWVGTELLKFIDEMQGIAFDSFFFMRYADPRAHVRLRFKGKQELLINKLFPAFHDWIENLRTRGLATKYSLDSYEPEIERYGGPLLVSRAEELFSADSRFVANCINHTQKKDTILSVENIGVINVISYVAAFYPHFEDQLNWLNRMTSIKKYTKEFREQRSFYMKMGNDSDNWHNLRTLNEGEFLYEQIRLRSIEMKAYIEEMRSAKTLYNKPDQILSSFIHLSLNRLIGINQSLEEKIMTFACHTLHNLSYIKKEKGLKIHVEI
ncbi:lantibiotic dehydratase [Paenibacillus algorifonticola]|uniref:lantibiotic dehydratase n=1 Tax=Paenibacillus algorifonticola TaxID=684063 RepID=UPI003D2A082A